MIHPPNWTMPLAMARSQANFTRAAANWDAMAKATDVATVPPTSAQAEGCLNAQATVTTNPTIYETTVTIVGWRRSTWRVRTERPGFTKPRNSTDVAPNSSSGASWG